MTFSVELCSWKGHHCAE